MPSVLADIPLLLPQVVRDLSTGQWLLAVFVGFPIVAIALNAFWQLVSGGVRGMQVLCVCMARRGAWAAGKQEGRSLL